jgi:hypothetical protein
MPDTWHGRSVSPTSSPMRALLRHCGNNSAGAILVSSTDAELFQKDVRTINEHLRNIYAEAEMDPAATIRKFRIVRREGTWEVAREIEHYSLDAILAVG